MESLPLKYKGASIVLQEVPDEISLAFNVSGCPVKCRGCHSKYFWEYNGELLSQDIDKWLNKYQEYITNYTDSMTSDAKNRIKVSE